MSHRHLDNGPAMRAKRPSNGMSRPLMGADSTSRHRVFRAVAMESRPPATEPDVARLWRSYCVNTCHSTYDFMWSCRPRPVRPPPSGGLEASADSDPQQPVRTSSLPGSDVRLLPDGPTLSSARFGGRSATFWGAKTNLCALGDSQRHEVSPPSWQVRAGDLDAVAGIVVQFNRLHRPEGDHFMVSLSRFDSTTSG